MMALPAAAPPKMIFLVVPRVEILPRKRQSALLQGIRLPVGPVCRKVAVPFRVSGNELAIDKVPLPLLVKFTVPNLFPPYQEFIALPVFKKVVEVPATGLNELCRISLMLGELKIFTRSKVLNNTRVLPPLARYEKLPRILEFLTNSPVPLKTSLGVPAI